MARLWDINLTRNKGLEDEADINKDVDYMQKIIRNCIKCNNCGDVIESTSVHDFKMCSCGRVGVDGGHEYLRRLFADGQDDFEELSVVQE